LDGLAKVGTERKAGLMMERRANWENHLQVENPAPLAQHSGSGALKLAVFTG